MFNEFYVTYILSLLIINELLELLLFLLVCKNNVIFNDLLKQLTM